MRGILVANSTELPVCPRPDLKVSRNANGADVVIAGLAEGSQGPVVQGLAPRAVKEAEETFGAPLAEVAIRAGGSTTLGSTVVLPWSGYSLVLVGCGTEGLDGEDLRKAAGAGARAAAALSHGTPLKVAVDMGINSAEQVRIAAEGALLGCYKVPAVTSNHDGPEVSTVTIVSNARGAKPELDKARILADAVYTARDWVDAPANLLYPKTFATSAQSWCKDLKDVTVEVLDEKALVRGGFGGILAVGGGSARSPRLVRVEYAPEGATTTLALVGKGITFDSGGLNIKTADGMYTMKCDMGGAAAVLAAVGAIARLGLNVRVIAYGCLAENMPSGSAWRPSDVVTIYGGKTVENGNSDAEGRIVMADGLARACEDEPDFLVDIATLTGACMVALGNHTAGVMTSGAQAADTLLDASEAAGEDFWELPITAEVRDALHSDVADVKSTAAREGGAMYAAAFLQSCVTPGLDWAHLDIAGPAYNNAKPHDYIPIQGTGFGVRTLVQLAANLAD
ncbi:leucyl aminopeptidase [Cutibacterium equinum]|uniref:Probable cytosol aminopeptidase n=1 Tax=Cutibacterium equinum TaxID=3016342 RepID=A0ABY7QZQ3_9ACTN|nr:leucyl aminopeptidase [Cutibacterium equinum]WCC80528.1 leucyl aminopeptidase [Cutibacterium equinum]